MKNYIFLAVFIFISLITMPLVAFSEKNGSKSYQNVSQAITETNAVNAKENESNNDVTVFLTAEKKNVTVSDLEYVLGSVACEMPLSYHEEALKAQAVACYTNLMRLKNMNSDEFNGADITDNPSVHQGYISQEERKEKLGKDYEKYESKLQKAVNEVLGKAVFYEDEYCIAAFSAICTGTTESSENVWGKALPYLVSVKSNGDTLSPSYSKTYTFTKAQFISIMKDLNCNLNKTDDLNNLIKITKTSKANYVLKIKIKEQQFSGQQIRDAFSLNSSSFKIEVNKNEVVFKTNGYGHGVGMSQYGADYMARQGSSYEEILKHYYKNTEIK